MTRSGSAVALAKTSRKPEQWANDINASWSRAVESADLACQYAIETGKKLLTAKADLKHGDFQKMVGKLTMTPRKAQHLMRIAARPELAKATSSSLLPKRWSVLSELARLQGAELTKAISYASPTTTPGGAREIVRIVKGKKPAKKHAAKMLPSPKEAKEIARRTGHIVLGSDGNYWSGLSEEESADAQRRMNQHGSIERAIEAIAECKVTPKQWIAESEDYWFIEWDVRKLDAAIKWLTELKPLLAVTLKALKDKDEEVTHAAAQ